MTSNETCAAGVLPRGGCTSDGPDARLRLAAMTTMASTLSHELLQPLTAASNLIDICARLVRARGAANDEDLLEMIAHADQQTARAAEIIRRMRSFVNSGRIDGRREGIPAMIAKVAAALRLQGRTDIQIVSTIAPNATFVLADRIQIEQVLTNLIANAVEALDDQSPRRIEINARRQVDDIVICVRDFGPGLSDAVHPRLFESLFTTKPGGSGLGLPICKTIVEAHGGELWAERPAGGGAAFCFSLPTAD
jgi:C4-dicarboxylate-specific signal transduction histidine kinase